MKQNSRSPKQRKHPKTRWSAADDAFDRCLNIKPSAVLERIREFGSSDSNDNSQIWLRGIGAASKATRAGSHPGL